jgi:hypothetical protein
MHRTTKIQKKIRTYIRALTGTLTHNASGQEFEDNTRLKILFHSTFKCYFDSSCGCVETAAFVNGLLRFETKDGGEARRLQGQCKNFRQIPFKY